MYRVIEFYYTTIFKFLQATDFLSLANFPLNSNTVVLLWTCHSPNLLLHYHFTLVFTFVN